MPKFSVIVPVYNSEKYLKKCLDSIMGQTYKDFEVIVVNDGSTDNSSNIIKKYNVKLINQDNSGVSVARNNGIKNSKGEYFIFVDSDDYIEKDLLKKINESLDNNPDIVRYQTKEIYNNESHEYHEQEFIGKNGEEAFKSIIESHFIDAICLYSIKRDYFLKNKFQFKKGLYHEDFGLIPIMIFKSKVVNSIDYCGYNYVKRDGSITTSNSYDKILKKVDDTLIHYCYLIDEGKKLKNTEYYNSFVANTLILKIIELKKEDYKKYKKILKKEKTYDYLLDNTLVRKIKKHMIKVSPRIYYKLIKRS